MQETAKPEKALSEEKPLSKKIVDDLLNKPLSEKVLDYLQSELFCLSLQLRTLGELVKYYGMEGPGLDSPETDGLGLILQSLAGKVHDCHEQALDWECWKDPQKETDNV